MRLFIEHAECLSGFFGCITDSAGRSSCLVWNLKSWIGSRLLILSIWLGRISRLHKPAVTLRISKGCLCHSPEYQSLSLKKSDTINVFVSVSASYEPFLSLEESLNEKNWNWKFAATCYGFAFFACVTCRNDFIQRRVLFFSLAEVKNCLGFAVEMSQYSTRSQATHGSIFFSISIKWFY